MNVCGTVPQLSIRLPTTVARVRFYVRSCGIYCDQSGTTARFLRVFRVPLPILIPVTAYYPVHPSSKPLQFRQYRAKQTDTDILYSRFLTAPSLVRIFGLRASVLSHTVAILSILNLC
jgi:hypothetical protein